jgi:hypothetical protein
MPPWAIAAALLSAQGISARFENLVSTLGEDFSPRIEIRDPIRVVDRVILEVRPRGQSEWRRTEATHTGVGDWWQGTFTSTSLWTSREEPELLELRAKVLGKRGGVLLDLGGTEPLEVQVLTKPEVEARERVFRTYSPGREEEDDGLSWFTGYVGTEGRANSGARARFLIGAGGAITDLIEAILYVSVGPAFSRPPELAIGGPIVLGLEASARIFTRPPAQYDLSLFAEPNLQVDLRFPGVDPGIGLRGGLSYRATGEVALELSLGGAAIWLRAIQADADSELGFSGTLRLALRFGGPKLIEGHR